MQSLFGYHTLFYYLSPLNDDLCKLELTQFATFAHWFARVVKFKRLGLDRFMLCHYSNNYHYILGRHFLAKYLKVRCCIDCNLPYEESMSEFATHKTNFYA